jgi:hypothetical protein
VDPSLAIGLGVAVLVVFVVVFVVVTAQRGAARRQARLEAQFGAAPAVPVLPTTSQRAGLPGWQAAGPMLQSLGMKMLDAETYTRSVDGGVMKSLYLSFHVRDGTLRAWMDKPSPGKAIESFIGTEATLRPGRHGSSPLGAFLVSRVGQALAALPGDADLTVKAPEIPGDDFKANAHTPFTKPEDAPALARLLMAVDEAASGPPPEGVLPVQLPPIALAWREAAAGLTQVGLKPLDAETYWHQIDGLRATIYVSLRVKEGEVDGRLEHACPGGTFEGFLQQKAALGPGDVGGSPLERVLAGSVREILGQLPRGARLTLEAPEIPGDEYKAYVSTPLSHPSQPALVARVLFAIDQLAQQRGPEPQALPPIVHCWRAAAPGLQGLGMHAIDAECFTRDLGGATLYLRVDVPTQSVHAWIERAAPGSMLDRFVGQRGEAAVGYAPRSELEAFAASAVGAHLTSLPPQARLYVKGPEIPGYTCELRLISPMSHPQHASTVAAALLSLDEVARRAIG